MKILIHKADPKKPKWHTLQKSEQCQVGRVERVNGRVQLYSLNEDKDMRVVVLSLEEAQKVAQLVEAECSSS